MKDPDHLDAIVKAQEAAKETSGEPAPGPPQSAWSHDLEALTNILDELRRLHFSTRMIAGDKKAKQPQPWPRPGYGRLIAARNRIKQAAHEKLAARLIRR